MKQFLVGLFVIPGILGALLIWHTWIASKPDGTGGEITNRVARTELVWLAMSKPRLFRQFLPGIVDDITERNQFSERRLLHSKAFDINYYLANNPGVAQLLESKPRLVEEYWLEHLDTCTNGSAEVSLPKVLDFLQEAVNFNGGCQEAAHLWVQYGDEWPNFSE